MIHPLKMIRSASFKCLQQVAWSIKTQVSSGDGGSESLQIADYGDSRDLTDDRSTGLRRSFDRIAGLFSRSKDCQMMSARLPTNQTQILTNLSQFWLTSRSVATTGLSASSREPFQSEASSAAVCWPRSGLSLDSQASSSAS